MGGDKRYGERQGSGSGWLHHGILSILLGVVNHDVMAVFSEFHRRRKLMMI